MDKIKPRSAFADSFVHSLDPKVCCIKGCSDPVLALGLCNRHWRRNRQYGSPVALKSQSGSMKGRSAVDRFWHQLKKGEGCWLWAAATDQDGYGRFVAKLAGKTYKTAHRFSYALHTGEVIPDGKVVMHSCDNPRCVNPDHLTLGSTRDNMLDKIAKGRANLPMAVLAPAPILTDEQVRAIVIDPRPHAMIAADYGVVASTISGIKRKISWKTIRIGDAGSSDGEQEGEGHHICGVKGCDLPALALGLCSEHWRRTREYGSPAVIKMHQGMIAVMPAKDRFWRQVKKTDGCWIWAGGTDKNGYGRMKAKVGGKIYRTAHRYSYTLHTGEIVPDDMVVMHSCDNPRCVNPDHLSLGTNRDNMLDKMAKERANVPKGELTGKARLTEKQVRAIVVDPRPHIQIAADYGVAASTIGSIKQGISWNSLGVEKIVHAKRIGMRGERQWSTKLTEADVREIRTSPLSGKELAEKFGLSPQAVSSIRKRRNWKHVD